MGVLIVYDNKFVFCLNKRLNKKRKTIRRLTPPNEYKEGEKMFWVELLILIASITIASIASYRKGYNNGFDDAMEYVIDLD